MYVLRGLSGMGDAQVGIAKKATDLFPPGDIAFLNTVWPTIRIAARWKDPNWAAIGFPGGPVVSPNSFQLMDYVWPMVRSAAKFSDINWAVVAIPTQFLPNVSQPVPEVTPAPVTPSGTMRTPESAPPPAVPVVGESYAPPVTVAPAPVTQPVPEAVQPYAPFPAPSLFPSLFGPAPTPTPGVTPAPAPLQAGMFGGNTLLMLGLGTAAALIFAVKTKKRGGGRRLRR